jgi:hypothetical protein
MGYLEREVLAPTLRVRLDAGWEQDTQRFARLPNVKTAGWSAGLTRRFYPPDEGGSDRAQRRKFAMLQLIPLPLLLAEIPPSIRPRMPEQMELLQQPPWDRLVGAFGMSFYDLRMKARGPDDLLLHGRHTEASQALGTLYEQLQLHRERRQAIENLGQQLQEWHPKALAAAARESRALQDVAAGRNPGARAELDEARRQVEALWKQYQRPLQGLVEGSAAEPRLTEVVYLRALCMHEQALALQRRWAQNRVAAELRDLHGLWEETVRWWQTFETEYASMRSAVGARLLGAEALSALAVVLEAEKDPNAAKRRADAAQAWETVAGDLSGVPQLGCRLQARKVREK